MKINININYRAVWGQSVCICGDAAELGENDEERAVPLQCVSESQWKLSLDIEAEKRFVHYFYLLKQEGRTVRREWGESHFIKTDKKKIFDIDDQWRGVPLQKFFYSSGFTGSLFFHPSEEKKIRYFDRTLLLNAICPFVKKEEKLVLLGDYDELGKWDPEKSLSFVPCGKGTWVLSVNASEIKREQGYKLAVYSEREKRIVRWESGYNRKISPIKKGLHHIVKIETVSFRMDRCDWKMAGTAIPVFSLRTEKSAGIGDFSDLKKLVDWIHLTGQKIIQLLPVNDTTITKTWTDSYPYSAISIYALHPIYLGLEEFPLEDGKKYKSYTESARKLNELKQVDYEKALSLKENYTTDLFSEIGEKTMKSAEFRNFYSKNSDWLFPYACFCYLRDSKATSDFSEWGDYRFYDEKKLRKLIRTSGKAKKAFGKACFVQYLLDLQMKEAKHYAHERNVILKGDIPIGISRNSVEAWVEPDYFNMDVQAGAPPDDFSFYGQNWGFPTYNWEKMKEDGYSWWKKRFCKMSDYFDAYRIDHILGFFRIWEIPMSSVEGLLGYFNPSLPFSEEEIRNYGFDFDEETMTRPFIKEDFLPDIFGEYSKEAESGFLYPTDYKTYALKENFDTQSKIRDYFLGKEDEKSKRIKVGLYALCNEVLFIKDKKEEKKFHPRITAQYSYAYRYLSDWQKYLFNKLYDDYFYRRHSSFWKEKAMEKLPELISSTNMLVCGEDLGMVPDCVPEVLKELQILSLEIERMPKSKDTEFEPLYKIPYLSVCTTSTHDMNPIQAWWKEDLHVTQRYYNQILWKEGAAPSECTPELCRQILVNHLNSPAMLVIFPLQDWLSIDPALRSADAESERINVPADTRHYWRYRMSTGLEDLIRKNDFNSEIKSLLKNSYRN